MKRYLTDLYVECIDDKAADGRGFWSVISPFIYESDLLGVMVIVESHFLTDFASVPRVPFAYWLLGDTAHKASVIHDWLYHHHEVCDEATANKVFLEACGYEGISWWRKSLLYAGVAVGGQSSWEEDGKGNGHSIVDGRIV